MSCRTTLNAVHDVQYVILVTSSDDEHDEGPFNLVVRAPSVPGNDPFETPAELGSALPLDAAGSSLDATAQASEPTGIGFDAFSTVWYRWIAPRTAVVRADTCTSDFPNILTVWKGADFLSLLLVAKSAGDSCGQGDTYSFEAIAGQTYLFRVGGVVADDQGSFTLHLQGPAVIPPPGPGPQPAPPLERKQPLKKCKKKKSKKAKKKCIKKAKKKAKG
jgi:hypothetical protein